MKTLQKRTKILVPSILSEALGGVPKIKLIPFLSKSRFNGNPMWLSHLIQLHIFPGVIYTRQNIEKYSQSS